MKEERQRDSSAPPEQLVGNRPVIEAVVRGVIGRFLVDTGSQVTTISEEFYQRHLAATNNQLHDTNNWLTIRAANGLCVPYIGYLELDVEVCGIVVPKRGVLVMSKREQGNTEVCGLLGTNVLSHVPVMSRALNCITSTTQRDRAQTVRVAGCQSVIVPGQSVMDIPARGYCGSETAIVEPLSTALVGNLAVLNTFVASRSFLVRVVNHSKADVSLAPGTRIGILRPATEHHSTHVEVGVNEIRLGATDEKDDHSRASSSESMNDIIAGLDLSGLEGDPIARAEVMAMLQRHASVFASSEDDLGCTDAVRHRIRTTDDRPVTQPYRRVPPTQLEEVNDHLEKLLRTGVIVPSYSDHASPIVLVRKKSGALRMCVDYRALNAKTVKDAYALPRIVESMDAMVGAKCFSTLDLQSAYNQVEMATEDQRKTAFTTPFGLYEFTRMPFGLCNSPATFQRLMQTVFHADMFAILLVYLDDIVVYSSTLEEHIARLDIVFSRLKLYGLKLEVRKCNLFKKSVHYLGHVVSGDGVATDPNKITAVREWAVPQTLRELRSFIGFTSYYRRYVPSFTQLATPLHQVVTVMCNEGKGRRRTSSSRSITEVWTENCQQSFIALKRALTTAPVLGFADYR